MPQIDFFLTPEEEKEIVDAIRSAEKNTSGEIRVHLENKTSVTPLQRAWEVFHIQKMDTTEQRNGILFYLAVEDKKFAIYADEGINAKVPSNFWDDIKTQMQEDFRKGDFCQGIVKGILSAGESLKSFFPSQNGDKNELPDDIIKMHQ